MSVNERKDVTDEEILYEFYSLDSLKYLIDMLSQLKISLPLNTFLYGIIGLPIEFSGFSSGKIFVISFHRSSGIRVIVLTYFLLFSIIGYNMKQTSYIPIYFLDRLLIILHMDISLIT